MAPERITLAPQQGDLAPIRAAARAREAGDRDGRLVVASAGRLVPDKNFGALIEAAARADPAGERLTLQIAGAGFEEPALRGLAARFGLTVEFLGAVAPAAMGDFYARAGAFALVSTFEPFGVVVREAVAAGLPLICSRRAGAAGDIAVEGRNAILVEPEDVEVIAAALTRLATDAGLRATLAAGSRAIDSEGTGADVAGFAAAAHAAAARRGRSRAH